MNRVATAPWPPGEGGPVIGEGRINAIGRGDDRDFGHLDEPSLPPQRSQTVRRGDWAPLHEVALRGHAGVEHGRRVPKHGIVGRDPQIGHPGGDHAAGTRDPLHLDDRWRGVRKNVQNQGGNDRVERPVLKTYMKISPCS